MNILLACDSSPLSVGAARALIGHARYFSAVPEAYLLFVHPPIPLGLASRHVSPDELNRYYREEGEEVLAAVAARLDAAMIPRINPIHLGDPATEIVKA